MLGSQNQGGMMEGANESTELWRHPWKIVMFVWKEWFNFIGNPILRQIIFM